ncbi:MAG TPA: penicillin-binding protein 2 [Usitatibacter sp.]|jgi:cell division protein FtsI (penicillin-binding protein 3)|nr:penicillin-binding protein 2 [Usitatibacter sp.]
MRLDARVPRFEKRTPELRLKLEGWRSRFVFVVVACMFTTLVGRAFYLQGVQTAFLQAKGEARYGRTIEMPASRGRVVDRNGETVAISTPAESIWASPEDLEIDDAQVRSLAKALAMDAADVRQKIARKDRQFVYLKRQISPEQATKVMGLRIPGIFQQREFRRFYPAGDVMAHVVGFTGVDDTGQEGIELAANARLCGEAGSRKVIRDRRGHIVEDVEALKPPRDGEQVTLAIDQRLQFLAHRELKAAVEMHHAKGGSIVILDARTGEVLALVNQPDYNPNNRAGVTPRQIRNRSVTDLFEPGSTMKPFTVAAALDAGLVKPDTLIQTGPGAMQLAGWTIRDTHANGLITVAQVIQKSSNIGSSKISLQMSPEHMWRFYNALGFGAAPQTGFPGEARGILRPWEKWRPIEQATMSYGNGISVSLLQLARAYTVFANDGELLPLSLLRLDAQPIGRPLVSPATAQEVVRMMEMAVGPGGTAPRAQVPGYRVAGKTGTAHKPENGRYAEHKFVSSFVGLAPVTKPRFIVAVMLDEPQGADYYGGDVGAPVFSTVMGQALRMMSVPPDGPGIINAASPRGDVEAHANPAGAPG